MNGEGTPEKPTQRGRRAQAGPLPCPNSRYVDLKYCAADLGVAVKTIRKRIADQELKAVRVGKQFRVAREEWESYLKRSVL